MRHRQKRRILSRTSDQRSSLLRHLSVALVRHERITTTLAKAKELRPFIEHCITIGRASGIHQRRMLQRRLQNNAAVSKILSELGPKFATRNGGYTRIVKLKRRQGDASQTAMIEFVEKTEHDHAH